MAKEKQPARSMPDFHPDFYVNEVGDVVEGITNQTGIPGPAFPLESSAEHRQKKQAEKEGPRRSRKRDDGRSR